MRHFASSNKKYMKDLFFVRLAEEQGPWEVAGLEPEASRIGILHRGMAKVVV